MPIDSVPSRWLKVSHHPAEHIASRYYYAAYGSNLSFRQMQERCPNVELVGAGTLHGTRLIFARFASIAEDPDVSVQVGIYKVSSADIVSLDRKEGLGRSYERFLVTPEVEMQGGPRMVRCFTYIKKDDRPEAPSERYYRTIADGYRDWKFSDRRLRRARARAQREELKYRLANKQTHQFYDPRGWENYEPLGGNYGFWSHSSQSNDNRTSSSIGFKDGKWGRWVDGKFVPNETQATATPPEMTGETFVSPRGDIFDKRADGTWISRKKGETQ